MSDICIVDDNATALVQMRLILQRAGFDRVKTFDDPRAALESFKKKAPGVLLLDYNMPELDGMSFLAAMWQAGVKDNVAVAMVSGHSDLDSIKLTALRAGVLEILPKPVNPQELALKVRNLQRLTSQITLGRDDDAGFQALRVPRVGESSVRSQGAGRSSGVKTGMPHADDATLLRMLERVAAIRDENTGKHTTRMAHYAATIGHSFGLSLQQQDQLLRAAPLHDIGKIAVPDAILLKPGRLTPDEMNVMKRHTTIGYELLRDEVSPVLQLGAEIALSHHEQWDGSGYPLGLSGDDIPISGRIVAVADAFDAMTTVRPYKQAWLVDRAVAVIEADAGRHFDPAAVSAFKSSLDNILQIKRHFDGDQVFAQTAALPH